MLLDGIYYGKTPIFRAYKNGQVIWGSGKDKYLLLNAIDINNNMIAQITNDALDILLLEYGMNIENNMYANSACSSKALINDNMSVNLDSTLGMQDLLNIDPVDISFVLYSDLQSNSSNNGEVVVNVSFEDSINISNSAARISEINGLSSINNDVVAHNPKGKFNKIDCQNIIDYVSHGRLRPARIILICDNSFINHNVFANTSLAKSNVINEREVIDDYMFVQESPSVIGCINENIVARMPVAIYSSKEIEYVSENKIDVEMSSLLVANKSICEHLIENNKIDQSVCINSKLSVTCEANYDACLISDTNLNVSDTEYAKANILHKLNSDLILYCGSLKTLDNTVKLLATSYAAINDSELDNISAHQIVRLNNNDIELIQSGIDHLNLYYNALFDSKNNIVSSESSLIPICINMSGQGDVELVISDKEYTTVNYVINSIDNLSVNLSDPGMLNASSDVCLRKNVSGSLSEPEAMCLDEEIALNPCMEFYISPEIRGDFAGESSVTLDCLMHNEDAGLSKVKITISNINKNLMYDSGCSDVHLSCDISHYAESKLSHGVFNWMPSFDTKCVSGCNTTLSMLPLEALWEYPVKNGTNLLITQAYINEYSDGRLVLN